MELYFEPGINPGHLVSKKLVIGFFAGWAWKDRLWGTSFNNVPIRYKTWNHIFLHSKSAVIIYNSRLLFYDGEQEARIPLKHLVSDSFLQKNAKENSCGVRIVFSIM